MATQTAAAPGPELSSGRVTEREARFLPGLRMLVAGIVGVLAGVALAVVASHQHDGAAVALVSRPNGRATVAQCFSLRVKTDFWEILWNKSGISSPAGTTDNSPALQRRA